MLNAAIIDIFESPLAISDSEIANVWLFTRKYYLSEGLSELEATTYADKVQEAFAAKVCAALRDTILA